MKCNKTNRLGNFSNDQATTETAGRGQPLVRKKSPPAYLNTAEEGAY